MSTSHDTPFFDHAANYTGHEVQAPRPLHEPGNVVDALLRLAVNPKDEEIVDADGFVKILLDGIAPPAAGDTAGAVRRPISQGTSVSGGRLGQ